MKTDSAFAGPAGVIVLDTRSAEYDDLPLAHPHRNAEVVFAQRLSQEITDCRF
jgi:hypothetical protein